MRVKASPRARRLSRLDLAYVLAVVLPVADTWLTEHVAVLHAVPYSPHLLAIVVLGVLGGLGPSLLSVPLVLLCRRWALLRGPQHDALSIKSELLHASVLVVAALVLWLMSQQRRRSERRLEITLDSLQERTDDLVAALASSRCACWTFDLDVGQSPRWYVGSYPIFGRPFAELEEMPSILSLMHAEDHPRIPALIEEFRSSPGPIIFEYRCPWPNGEIHWLEMRGNRVPDKPNGWRGVTVDITERKLTEAALLRSEKLAAMGRIASTVAHEINNPLEAVTNLLYLARSDSALTESTLSYLTTAERELARLGNITRLTLGFVRSSGTAALVELSSVAEDVLTIFAHRFEMKNIQVERHYQRGVSVYIAPHELRQVVTNLVANAADAVADTGGCVSIHICGHDGLAVLLLEDNGSGVDPANAQRIFEPFFTTKEEVGTGIGLWVTRELVEKNGGRIGVESSRGVDSSGLPPGVSTRFRVEFPLANE